MHQLLLQNRTGISRKNGSLLKLVKPEWDGRSLAKCCMNGTSEFMSEVSMSIVGIIYNMHSAFSLVRSFFSPPAA